MLHAYYRYHFKRAGILDKETEKVLSDLFAVSFWQFGFFSSSLDNIGRGGVSTWNLDSDWKAKHVLLPFPRSLQEIVYPMASGGYIGHQAPALAILIYFQRRDFVQTLKDSFRSTANRLTVPLSEADKAALGGKDMFWPFGLPSDLLISRLLNLVVAIRHLTEDEDYGFQFYDFAMSSFLRSRTTSRLPALSGETDNLERPHTPEFLAEVHKLALELIST